MELYTIILGILVLVFSAVIHEVSHGAAADALGDPTAKSLGRLTLNPIKHLDFFGSIVVPLFLVLTKTNIFFAWAKPVPFNPNFLRDQRFGPAKVAAAGPLANLAIALFFGLIIRFVPFNIIEAQFNLFFVFALIVQINISLAVFNLMPVPPLDGSHILFAFLPVSWAKYKYWAAQLGFFLLIFFVVMAGEIIVPMVGKLFWLITGISLS